MVSKEFAEDTTSILFTYSLYTYIVCFDAFFVKGKIRFFRENSGKKRNLQVIWHNFLQISWFLMVIDFHLLCYEEAFSVEKVTVPVA